MSPYVNLICAALVGALFGGSVVALLWRRASTRRSRRLRELVEGITGSVDAAGPVDAPDTLRSTDVEDGPHVDAGKQIAERVAAGEVLPTHVGKPNVFNDIKAAGEDDGSDEAPVTVRSTPSPRKILSLFLALLFVGCAVPLGSSGPSVSGASYDAQAVRCQALDDRRAWWGGVEVAALSVAGSSGVATLPAESDELEIATAAVSAAAAAVAILAMYTGQNATETWARECSGAPEGESSVRSQRIRRPQRGEPSGG